MISDTPVSATALFERFGRGGFLRSAGGEYRADADDPIVPPSLCKKLGLRGGELIEGVLQNPSARQKGGFLELHEVLSVNGRSVAKYHETPLFDDLPVADAAEPIALSAKGGPLSMRLIDLFAPIGLGQRTMLVAPPRTGKTILVQQVAHALAAKHPDYHTVLLLIDERPEDVTDMRRSVPVEVVASSSAMGASNHVRLAELMTERAKRMVESGHHVVLIIDSLTRLGRAYNAEFREPGRVLSGEFDPRALEGPKSLLEAARRIEGGGSLTILGTLLVDTGSELDGTISQELEGLGSGRIVLSSALARERVWPALDVAASGSELAEHFVSEEERAALARLRKKAGDPPRPKAVQKLFDAVRKSESNEDFLTSAG